jgi:hypothetical protein
MAYMYIYIERENVSLCADEHISLREKEQREESRWD